ncbi:MAG TPA: transcriptional regulator, partial [Allocoleopsis sp.]
KTYNDFLMEKLTNSEHAAGFIEAILAEKDPEPELLRNALFKVIEAYKINDKLTESARINYQKLEQILTDSNGKEIYTFMQLLEDLGWKFSIFI